MVAEALAESKKDAEMKIGELREELNTIVEETQNTLSKSHMSNAEEKAAQHTQMAEWSQEKASQEMTIATLTGQLETTKARLNERSDVEQGLHSQLTLTREALHKTKAEAEAKIFEREEAHQVAMKQGAALKSNSEQRLIAAMEAAQVGFDNHVVGVQQQHQNEIVRLQAEARQSSKAPGQLENSLAAAIEELKATKGELEFLHDATSPRSTRMRGMSIQSNAELRSQLLESTKKTVVLERNLAAALAQAGASLASTEVNGDVTESEMSAAIAAADRRFGDATKQMEELHAEEKASLDKTVANLKAKTEAMSSKIEMAESKASRLEAELAAAKSATDVVERKGILESRLQEEVTSLQEKHASSSIMESRLQGQVGALQEEIATSKREHRRALEEQAHALERAHDEAQELGADSAIEAQRLRGELSSLRSELSAARREGSQQLHALEDSHLQHIHELHEAEAECARRAKREADAAVSALKASHQLRVSELQEEVRTATAMAETATEALQQHAAAERETRADRGRLKQLQEVLNSVQSLHTAEKESFEQNFKKLSHQVDDMTHDLDRAHATERDSKAQLAAHHKQHRVDLAALQDKVTWAVEVEKAATERSAKLLQELEACKLLLEVEQSARDRSQDALARVRNSTHDERRGFADASKSSKADLNALSAENEKLQARHRERHRERHGAQTHECTLLSRRVLLVQERGLER